MRAVRRFHWPLRCVVTAALTRKDIGESLFIDARFRRVLILTTQTYVAELCN